MVASQNVAFSGVDEITNLVRDLQRQIDELTRRSTYPFSAGPGGGTFQIFPDATIVDANGKPVVDTVLKYETGRLALSIRPGATAYGSKQQMALYDLAGNAMYRTDESAGYGLSAPLYSHFMAPLYEGTAGVSNAAGVEVATARAEGFFYNPAIYAKCLVAMGAGVSFSGRFRVTNGTTSVFSSSSTFSGPAYIAKMLLLPSEFMGAQGVTVDFLCTPSVTGTAVTTPSFCVGTTKAGYTLNPAWQ